MGLRSLVATFIGLLEIMGAIMLVVPKTSRVAILILVVIMFGAVYTHVANGEYWDVLRPAIFLGLMGTVWTLRRRSKNKIDVAN